MNFLKKICKITAFYALMLSFTAAMILAGLKAVDMTFVALSPPNVQDAMSDRVTMRTFEYYPYTENHIQPDFHEKGKLPWTEFYTDFDVVSGDHGFFIDFDLDFPPAKPKDEFRIILIGGSGAQGWGGKTNADMFYTTLEKELNEQLQAKSAGFHVRVINMAMASSVTYQNFLALNKWGHALDPDMILSFAGHNELAVPANTRDDTMGNPIGGILKARRFGESPKWVRKLARHFPGLVHYTNLTFHANMMALANYQVDWVVRYFLANYDPQYHGQMTKGEMAGRYHELLAKQNTLRDLSIPLYRRGLQSIKRDFLGIPMVIAFQPILSKNNPTYNEMMGTLTKDMAHYMNEDNYIINMHHVWEKKDFYSEKKALVDSVHLSNEGHAIITQQLKEFMYPIITDLRKRQHSQAKVKRS